MNARSGSVDCDSKPRTAAVHLAAPLLFAMCLSAQAEQMKLNVLAPNAVKEAVSEVAAHFEKETGHRVVFSWGGSESIFRRVQSGEVFDVVLSTSAGVERLAAEGKLDAGTTTHFSRSGVAAAVRAGLPRPDVSTVEGLRTALHEARSIAISSGASGRYMEKLFASTGVKDRIERKIVQPPSGAQIGDLLTKGEADLGFQQVTELIGAKGIDYLGPLPAELQNYTIWSAGLHVGTLYPDAGRSFIGAIAAPSSAAAMRRTGLEPLAAKSEAPR